MASPLAAMRTNGELGMADVGIATMPDATPTTQSHQPQGVYTSPPDTPLHLMSAQPFQQPDILSAAQRRTYSANSAPHSQSSSPGLSAARARTAAYTPSIPSPSPSMLDTSHLATQSRSSSPFSGSGFAQSYVNGDPDLSQQSRPSYKGAPDLSPRPGSRAPLVYINGSPQSTPYAPSPYGHEQLQYGGEFNGSTHTTPRQLSPHGREQLRYGAIGG